ncbi:hypothetical protein CgunFtcFv8_009545 [Champsocephalus gunnari]|uniref:Uncharacterized protein n=1 Tax=Champsocephalus gunnari TaxID=52237 RepID=A0AAN8C2K2_CHAGU|nr:hypothetical protein CgunFtcFv8_009545 [Champsocephalus gunnari]
MQNPNLTQPEVTHWESTPLLSSTVNNTIIVLGVLTFALQLCLALLFMLRCWRFDNRVQEALKHPETAGKLIALSSFHIEIYKQASFQLCGVSTATPSPIVTESPEEYEPFKHHLFAPSIPWDLVQR